MFKKYFNKILLNFLIVIFIFAFDRISKLYVLKLAETDQFVNIYINQFLNFHLIWNTGIGFGLFDHNTALIYNSLTLIIGFVLLALIYIAIFSEKIDTFIFSIIIGGALGNFYDRLRLNAVPDFIDIHYMNFHWFTFNVADIFITLGIITFLLKDFFIKKNEK